MKIFELSSDVERYRWLTATREDDFNVLADLPGTTVGDAWTPICVEWIEDDLNAGKPVSDYPPLGNTPVFSQKAVRILSDLLIPRGELLPLKLNGIKDQYYAFNSTSYIDALDESRTDLVRFDTGRIMMVNRYAFFDESLHDAVIFSLPQLRASIFVSSIFAERVRKANLKGFVFDEVWRTKV